MKSTGKSIEKVVEGLLHKRALGRNYKLRVVRSQQDDKWIRLSVAPDKPGIPAYAFAELLTKVEQSVRESEKKAEILLIPAMN